MSTKHIHCNYMVMLHYFIFLTTLARDFSINSRAFFWGNPDLYLPVLKSVFGHPWEKIMFA